MTINYLSGKIYWAKVFTPTKGYNPDEREWSFDLALEPEGVSKLVALGLTKGIKNKGDDRGPFYTFKRRELKKKTGKPNNPITVRTKDGEFWDSSIVIGNGSKVEVKFNVFEVPAFAKLPAHNKDAVLEVSVQELVEYVRPKEPEFGSAPITGGSAGYKESWKGDIV